MLSIFKVSHQYWRCEGNGRLRPVEGKGKACQVGECGKSLGAGRQVTYSEAIDWIVWLEDRRVSHSGQVSVGPVVGGPEYQSKRSGLDSLGTGEPLMVLENRHSMIGAVFSGDELVDRVDQRTETLPGR